MIAYDRIRHRLARISDLKREYEENGSKVDSLFELSLMKSFMARVINNK